MQSHPHFSVIKRMHPNYDAPLDRKLYHRRIDTLSSAPRSSDQMQPLLSPKSLVGGNGLVGEDQSTPLALPDHELDRIKQVAGRSVRTPELPRCFQVIPGYLKRILDQSW